MKSDPHFTVPPFSDLTVLTTRTRGRNYNTILHIYFDAVRREKSNVFVCEINVHKPFYESRNFHRKKRLLTT